MKSLAFLYKKINDKTVAGRYLSIGLLINRQIDLLHFRIRFMKSSLEELCDIFLKIHLKDLSLDYFLILYLNSRLNRDRGREGGREKKY